MPDIIFETKEAIPEGLRDKAVEKAGKFVVDVVHSSFRDNNITLLKERDTLNGQVTAYKEKFGEDIGKTASELEELRGIKQKVTDGTLKASGDIEAEVAKRTLTTKEQFQGQLQAQAQETAKEKAAREAAEDSLRNLIVKQGITAAVLDPANGANPAALDDLIERGRKAFRVNKDGALIRMDGDAMIYGASGEASETPKEWLAKVLKVAPYLSKESVGAGAGGGERKGVFGKTPEELKSMSPEERLRAARAEAAAGK